MHQCVYIVFYLASKSPEVQSEATYSPKMSPSLYLFSLPPPPPSLILNHGNHLIECAQCSLVLNTDMLM